MRRVREISLLVPCRFFFHRQWFWLIEKMIQHRIVTPSNDRHKEFWANFLQYDAAPFQTQSLFLFISHPFHHRLHHNRIVPPPQDKCTFVKIIQQNRRLHLCKRLAIWNGITGPPPLCERHHNRCRLSLQSCRCSLRAWRRRRRTHCYPSPRTPCGARRQQRGRPPPQPR